MNHENGTCLGGSEVPSVEGGQRAGAGGPGLHPDPATSQLTGLGAKPDPRGSPLPHFIFLLETGIPALQDV